MIDQHQAGRGYSCAEQGKEASWWWWSRASGCFGCLWHWNLCYRSHDLPQVTEFKVKGKKERYAYIIVLHFKSNITIAMHVSQRLVYISGTITNVECAWEPWLSATFYLMSIACLVAKIFNYHSEMWKHCNGYVAHCTSMIQTKVQAC